jgi:hypothetical protein
MSTYERSIVSILDPSIKVDEIFVEDQESEKAKQEKSGAVPSTANPKILHGLVHTFLFCK